MKYRADKSKTAHCRITVSKQEIWEMVREKFEDIPENVPEASWSYDHGVVFQWHEILEENCCEEDK